MQLSRIEPGFQVRPIHVRDHADVLQGDHLRVSVALRAPGTSRTPAPQDQQGIGFDRDLGLLCHEALSEMARLQNGAQPVAKADESPWEPHEHFLLFLAK